jgi:hypothetical protein
MKRIALVLTLMLALAGCGGGNGGDGVATAGDKAAKASASAGASKDHKEQALRHAQCMRDNGVTDYPDPKFNENGGTSLNLPEGIDPAKLDRAAQACRQYEPNGGEPQKLDAERLDQLRAYATCMRENGVENFPDPTDQGIQADGNKPGMDPASPSYQAADKVCAHFAPKPEGGEGPGLNTDG